MKTKIMLALMLLITTTLALGQPKSVPTCNSFDTAGYPIFSPVGFGDINGTTLCTDYFGKANYANSPLPVGPLDISATGFTVLNGGSGYTAPTVAIDDFYATPGITAATGCTATVTGGTITAVSCTSGGNGYMAPVVTITDATGTGAQVLAKLASATPGTGMRKFVDALPDLKSALATPDTAKFAGSDFYVIGLVQYPLQMHVDLPPTTLRMYCQLADSSATSCSNTPAYLGPVILAGKNRPVRVLFKNLLSPGTGGDLFIPVDPTYMGAGVGPDGASPYLENRATLHLHGGNTPWISDGTPHQWTVPAGDSATTYARGVSTRFVPDMWFDATGALITNCAGQTTCTVDGATNDPGPGNMTFYWTNQQGGRLMFYHDHAYGITRLNVYAGEAAGFLLYDPAEESALLNANAGVPGTLATNTTTQPAADLPHLIPIVIQDKTFVPNAAQLAAEDPTWIWGTRTPPPGNNGNGDIWFNHVYPPNQNPADMGGANAFGRWDYGPWFFPPQTTLSMAGTGPLGPNTAVTVPCTSSAFPGQLLQPSSVNNYLEGCPIIPNPSGTPEGFMDTPLVNGKAYPVLHVAPEAYRFHLLSAGNDRSLNLSWYQACGSAPANAFATNCSAPGAAGTEVPMVPAVTGITGTAGYIYPDQLDGRQGGVPDSTAKGPSWYEIGSEGGLMPNVAVIPPTPVGFEYNRRSITVLNVSSHGLLLGPAERAQAIVDFSAFAGKTLILYNDAPAPIPAFDSRIDYYTGDPDQVQTGGAPTTLPGYGPNTRTVMQVVVDLPTSGAPAFSPTGLQAALPGIYATTTAPLPAIVPEPTYPVATGGNSATSTYSKISDNNITFTPITALANYTSCASTPPAQCVVMDQKAIQELFTLDYGRMNATLGTELPLTNFLVQTTLPFGYAEWPTEIIQDGQTQVWKLTHNGVDTHFVHFHLFNVQVINRIGWDGAVKPPDANELGWKDTVRMNPLEDIVVALQPLKQNLPWPVPDSIRSLDVTMLDGTNPDPTISGIDPATGNAIASPFAGFLGTAGTMNEPVNFGWEYVWHCHILGHEENDMMRPIVFQVAPPAPSNLTATANASGGVTVTWADNSASETSFTLQRDTDPTFPNATAFTIDANTAGANFTTLGYGGTVTFVDSQVSTVGTVYYRVQAVDDFTPTSPLQPPFQTVPMMSAWVGPVPFGAAPIAVVTPKAINFGNVLVGTAAGPQSITLSNTGTAVLNITAAISLTGANPGDFALPAPAANACGASLNPGANCTINVTFTPTAVGARTALVTVISNDPVNGTLNVPLSGSGTANTATSITLAAPSITYGRDGIVTVNVTSPQGVTVTGTVTLSVDGGAAVSQTLVAGSATFNSTNTPALLAPTPPSHSLTAAYAAQAGFGASSANGTLTVNPAPLTINPSPNPATMTFGGVVPTITPTYSGFVLAQGPANLTGTVTCTTTATSTSPVSGNPYSSSCAGATSTNYAITYGRGAVTINQASSTTTITSNLPNPSILGQIVTVSFRVAPQFTGTPAGTVTINASTGERCIGGLSGGLGSCTITFSTGGSRTLTATYGGDTNFLGSVSTASNQMVSGLSLSTNSLLFGNQLVGTNSAAQTVTLTNVGTSTITITNIQWSANFSDTNNCGGTLAPGRSCRINVRFAPTTTGVLTGTLTITDSDPTSPQVVTLTGTGVQPAATLSPASHNFGTVLRGQSVSTPFTLTNSGTAPLTINGISISGANPNQFSQTNNCGTTLAVGANCTITVRFSPTRRGGLSATLNVRDSAPGSPQTAALTGTGQ